MIWWLVVLWVAIPVVAIFISGRKRTWRGYILLVLLWPVLWLFEPPEELP